MDLEKRRECQQMADREEILDRIELINAKNECLEKHH